MNYTPFATLTDKELVAHVCTKKDPTDLELELMLRLERAQERTQELEERVVELTPS